jgi:ribosomal protein L19E
MTKITPERYLESLNHVAGTEEGQIVLAQLMHDCGWSRTYLSSEEPEVTQYYAARRGVYNGLRQHIRREYLKKIEFDFEIKSKGETKDVGRKRKPGIARAGKPTGRKPTK